LVTKADWSGGVRPRHELEHNAVRIGDLEKLPSSNPKWRMANSADAEGSPTLSEIADAVILISERRSELPC
jgi:hypothetical protein